MDFNEELLKQVNKITGTTYHQPISEDDLVSMVCELVDAVDSLKEQLETEIEQKIEYWKPKTPYEILGDVKESDFYES